MLKRMRIGQRLFLAFGFVLLLLILAVGFAVFQMGRMGGDLNRVMTLYAREDTLAATMRYQAQGIQLSVRSVLLSDEGSQNMRDLQQIKLARDQYQKASDELDRLVKSPKAKSLLMEIQDKYLAAIASNNQVLSLNDGDKHKEAVAMLFGEGQARSGEAMAALQAMSDFTQQQMTAAYASARAGQRIALGGHALAQPDLHYPGPGWRGRHHPRRHPSHRRLPGSAGPGFPGRPDGAGNGRFPG